MNTMKGGWKDMAKSRNGAPQGKGRENRAEAIKETRAENFPA
jgi:hypothetical protein